jgi:Asp/Glu/hydantoin racemase
MGKRVLVINPNSNTDMTDAMDRSLERMRYAGGPEITCVTLAEGPLGIETHRQSNEVTVPLCALIEREKDNYDAFVVGCFGDPGVVAAREISGKPVIGLCEAGVSAAINFAETYGIVTNMASDATGEVRLLRAQGLEARLVGIEAINIAVTGLVDTPEVRGALIAAARRLGDRGAQGVVLGCAGMSRFAPEMRKETGLRVVDPVIAAAGMAFAAIASMA